MRGTVSRKLRKAVEHTLDEKRLQDESREMAFTPMYKEQTGRLYWTIKKPDDKEIAEQFAIGNRLYKLSPLVLATAPGRRTYQQLKKAMRLEKLERVS